jgi:hypothetical protein
VAEICGHERGIGGERMRGDRRVEILDPDAAAFEERFDPAVGVTHRVRPLCASDLGADPIEAILQSVLRLDRGSRSIPNAISATTGCGMTTTLGSVAAKRATTVASPFIREDTTFVSRTYVTDRAAASIDER